MEIIRIHIRGNRTGVKAAAKTSAKKTGTKTDAKAPRSGYHLFLREKLDEMTREDQKNHRSIV